MAVVAFIERLHDPLPASVGDVLSESEQAGTRFVRRLDGCTHLLSGENHHRGER